MWLHAQKVFPGPFRIVLIRILISIARKSVNIPRKRKKVVCTAPTLTLDTQALTGSRPWIAHGCLPTSATIQPAWPER